MKYIFEAAQPYVLTILQALLGLLALLIIAGIRNLQKKAEIWLEARTTESNRETLHKVAAEAYAYVEKQYKDHDGQKKLQTAIQYVLQRCRLDKMGITTIDVEAAVQKAWTVLDKKLQQ